MKRRTFIGKSSIASIACTIPAFLKPFEGLAKVTGRKLVIVQLGGGNDGLNTIVPFRNDIYYSKRPQLAIQANEVLKLNNELGLNPLMTGLRSMFDAGDLSIVNNIGYPNPSRSHFRSMDIWHTASNPNEHLNSGWIGRILETDCNTSGMARGAIEIGGNLSLALKGHDTTGLAFKNKEQLFKSTREPYFESLAQLNHESGYDNVSYLYKTLKETYSSASYINVKTKGVSVNTNYPHTNLGRQLKSVAEFIQADLDTDIYYTSIGGFDTHANQRKYHDILLGDFSDACASFRDDMKSEGLWNNVLVLAFSEFGRRVKQNASRGTDHGAGSNLYLMGGSLKKPGFYNDGPDLKNLDFGDVRYSIDFRQVYATILEKWLCTDSQTILGRRFAPLEII
jgi:uncharacterized protein (DUF1501 family)